MHEILCQLIVTDESRFPLDLCMNTLSMVSVSAPTWYEIITESLWAIGQWIMMDVDDGYVLW